MLPILYLTPQWSTQSVHSGLHKDTRIYSGMLFAFKYSNSEDVLNIGITTRYFIFLDVGRSSLSTFVGKIKNSGKLFMSLACLASRQESEKLISEPTDNSFHCHLCKTCGWESPEKFDFMTWFLVGPSTNTRK